MAIGVNWGEVWAPVWQAVWTQSPPVTPPDTAPTGPTPAGKAKRRRYVVAIDGQDFIVESAQHAQALLDRARALAVKDAPERAEAVVAKRIKAKAPEGRPIRVPVPQIYTPDPELVAVVARMRTEINRVYREAALAAEIALRLRMLEDDDDEVLLLL